MQLSGKACPRGLGSISSIGKEEEGDVNSTALTCETTPVRAL